MDLDVLAILSQLATGQLDDDDEEGEDLPGFGLHDSNGVTIYGSTHSGTFQHFNLTSACVLMW